MYELWHTLDTKAPKIQVPRDTTVAFTRGMPSGGGQTSTVHDATMDRHRSLGSSAYSTCNELTMDKPPQTKAIVVVAAPPLLYPSYLRDTLSTLQLDL